MSNINFNSIFGNSYADGAVKSTLYKPKFDGNIDITNTKFAKNIREQVNYFNLNETDIPSFVSSITSKTMGISINMQVESDDEVFNSEAEEYIDIFCRYGNCEVTGQHTFNSSSRTISDFEVLSGGILIRHHYNNIWDIPYRYELVSVDMIDTNKTNYVQKKESNTTILNGFERDKYGKIVALYIYNDRKKRTSTRQEFKNFTYFSKKWVSIDQQMAITKLTSLLKKLDSSNQYEEAEIISALEEAKAGHYIKSSVYNEIMLIVGDIIKKKASGKKNAEAIAESIDLASPVLQQLSNLGVSQKGLTPIPSSDEIIFNNSKRNGVYKDLTQNAEMKMASSMGVSDTAVYSKVDKANYSAIKYIMEVDKMSSNIRFDDISKIVFNDIFTRLIKVGVQTGAITNRQKYWKNPYKFNKFRYLRQNAISIEPTKTAIKNKTNLSLGLTTEAIIIEEEYGIKYEVFLKKKYQQEILKEKMRLDMFEKAGLSIPKKDIKQ